MCGILALLSGNLSDEDVVKSSSVIDARGPDYSSPLLHHETECGLDLLLKASVLHLRGNFIQKQPVIDDNGNAFMFNGQVYKFDSQVLPSNISDTSFLAERLGACKTKQEISETISHIDGPFAFVYWHNGLHTLFYGRDIFGRRSLCLLREMNTSKPLMISSVCCSLSSGNCFWSEVDCKSIHCIEYVMNQESVEGQFKWNIDDIYPLTNKCSENFGNEETLGHVSTKYLSSLNFESKRPAEFTNEERCKAVNVLGQKLTEAVFRRVVFDKKDCLMCRGCRSPNRIDAACKHSKLAVAFSGGIDSTLIALALDKMIDKDETIDLVTVAFKSGSPDRDSVGRAFTELIKIRSDRNWRLVLCDISLDELKAKRDEKIRDLISPCNTVIDDSLGCACWFIGRAMGRAIDSRAIEDGFNLDGFLEYNTQVHHCTSTMVDYDYKSPASIIFVGSSIDEQLGGYSSHRCAWSRLNSQGLIEEISFQMRRLSSRNLGRDDRSYSDHGRDVRIPYLDFELVSFLNELPIGLKMNLDEPMDVGPKKILRELAKSWGLCETSRRIKRAMQFGSRIANLEDKKEKGNEICFRLQINKD